MSNQPEPLYYIAIAEGWLQFSITEGKEQQMININGITRNIRKATAINSKQRAVGIAKFAIDAGESSSDYYAIMHPAIL